MSENKCPCCGGVIEIEEKEGCVDCYECQFGCALSDLPRIAAAMELAKGLAKMRDLACKRPTSDADEYNERVIAMSESLEEYQLLKDRVLEVFNE